MSALSRKKNEQLRDFMRERFGDQSGPICDALKDFDHGWRMARKAEKDELRKHRAKVNRDFGRGIYSRWATNAAHDPTWCDSEDCAKTGYAAIPVGSLMYMEVDHKHRDPELDVPHVRVFCETCAADRGIAPMIRQPKFISEGAPA